MSLVIWWVALHKSFHVALGWSKACGFALHRLPEFEDCALSKFMAGMDTPKHWKESYTVPCTNANWRMQTTCSTANNVYII
jgi:hypothetical protein